jgi:hypothetical protein
MAWMSNDVQVIVGTLLSTQFLVGAAIGLVIGSFAGIMAMALVKVGSKRSVESRGLVFERRR